MSDQSSLVGTVMSLLDKKNNKNLLLTLVVILFLFAGGIYAVNAWKYRHPPSPLITQFEGIRQQQQLRFVQQRYEEVIPMVSLNGKKLEFLIIAPAEIHGQMDMTQMNYEEIDQKKKILKVSLPAPQLSEVWINLDSIREYKTRGKSLSIMLGGGGRKYEETYDSIASQLDRTKQAVIANSIKNGILLETRAQARQYVLQMARGLGYRVEFVDNPRKNNYKTLLARMTNKPLKKEVKDLLDDQIKGWNKGETQLGIAPEGEETEAEEKEKKDFEKKAAGWLLKKLLGVDK